MTRRVIIVGGGLAGAAAAARLAALGAQPVLFEREAAAHDKICGEFLSVEAGRHLEALGFDTARLGGARIDTVRIHAGRRTAQARLPFVATGVSRRLLDDALLDHARGLGANVQRGVAVRRLARGRVVTALGELSADTMLLATGKHEVRGEARDRSGTIDGLIGFKQYFRVTAALQASLAGAVEVTAFDGGYAGVQRVEGGVVNLCLLVSRERFAALGSWEALLAALWREPGLAALADAEPLLAKPLTISNVPYGFVYHGSPGDTLYRLGDQAAVIPSFCGDGMAMALHSGRLAADMVHGGATPAAYHAQLRADVARQVRLATRLQRLSTSRLGRFALIAGLAAAPAVLAALARWTRVEPQAVARAGA